VNEEHLRLCASAEWAERVETEIFPWALGDRDLGDDVLEIGPGPGLTTERLVRRVPRLTAVEADELLAADLEGRLGGVMSVLNADATAMPFEDGRFSAAASFTMLHHVPTAELQDALLAEVARVLRPGGLFVGVDSRDRPEWRRLHEGDTCVPVDPATFADRLRAAGFAEAEVEATEARFRFAASTPNGAASG